MKEAHNRWSLPALGLGLGLRTVHYPHVLKERPQVDWFELLSENFMNTGGRPLWVLEQIVEQYPLVLHGVSLSIGSTDPLNLEYLAQLKALAERSRAEWVGDHVCWTGVAGRNNHDLLPLPYHETSLRHLVERIQEVQDFLERPLILENPSTYLCFAESDRPEAVFLQQMAERADCGLLLDVNNIYVSCRNHGWSVEEYLDEIPYDRVVQIHIAGHTDKGTHIIDTHIGPVPDPVWEIYAEVMRRAGDISTLLEWDEEIPPFEVAHADLMRAGAFRSHSGVRA